jgi:hypothetical protein
MEHATLQRQRTLVLTQVYIYPTRAVRAPRHPSAAIKGDSAALTLMLQR